MNFQAQYTKSPITIPSGDTSSGTGGGDPVPTGIPKRAITVNPTQLSRTMQPAAVSEHPQIAPKKTLPVISSVTSLAAIANGQSQSSVQLSNAQTSMGNTMQPITLQGNNPVRTLVSNLITKLIEMIFNSFNFF